MIIEKDRSGIKTVSLFLVLLCILALLFPSCRTTKVQERHVADNRLISPHSPEVAFDIKNSFTFAADTSFILKDKYDVELFYFTDVESGPVNKYLLFQFESILPDSAGTFSYGITDSISMNDLHFIYNYYCFNPSLTAKYVPNSDIAVGQELLRNNGFVTPGSFAGIRYINLSEDKRSELLVIYGEQAELRNIDCESESGNEVIINQLITETLEILHSDSKSE